jgi:hypothetical protein
MAMLTVVANAERTVGGLSNVWEGRDWGPARARAMGERETDEVAYMYPVEWTEGGGAREEGREFGSGSCGTFASLSTILQPRW